MSHPYGGRSHYSVVIVGGGQAGLSLSHELQQRGIDHLVIENKVYIKSNDQIATGDTGKFDMKTQVLVLSGKEVVLSQGDNVLKGCKLTVQMKSGLGNVEGCPRVIMMFKPQKQDATQKQGASSN